MKELKFYNTLTRKIEPLQTLIPNQVGVYCCGPTVYSFQHIGNFKTFIFEDVLVRTIRTAGYKVKHVMNITDVGHLTGDGDDGEDKMLVAMQREGKTSKAISEFYTTKFFDDWKKLNLMQPDVVCKATDHIQDMIDLIKKIESNGYAYFANGNVYFDVTKFAAYGKLAKLNLQQLQAGARIDIDPHKRSPFDFVLWFTKSKFENQELQWDSPWGRGYPGWHIECSAMSMKYLGEQFDIHCGGIDHIPVHHTNEIAQSEAAIGKNWVNLWLHSEFILINSEKMSKSTGKLLILDDLINSGFTPEAFRFFCLSANYRAQLNFSYTALESAQNNVDRLKKQICQLKEECSQSSQTTEHALLDEFYSALYNDLNTPVGLATVWKIVADEKLESADKLALLYQCDLALGLGFENWQLETVTISAEALELLEQRNQARSNKNWQKADEIRSQLLTLGFKVEDAAGGAKLVKI